MAKDLTEVYGPLLETVLQNSDPDLFAVTTSKNVYQLAQKQNRPHFKYIMEDLMLPGSGIEGADNIRVLNRLAKSGKSTLILSSHYTNFDVPALYTLMYKAGEDLGEIFEDIVFIAGRKLTEGSKSVKALAEMFSRVVISAKAQNMTRSDIKLALAINKAAQKKMTQLKQEGKIFLIYPTGTRTRVQIPRTAHGIREIYNYVKKFDYIMCCGAKGNILPARDDVPMINEFPRKDKVIFSFGKVKETNLFLTEMEEQMSHVEVPDKKQWVIDRIMDEIYSLGDDPRKINPKTFFKYNPGYINITNQIKNVTSMLTPDGKAYQSSEKRKKYKNAAKSSARSFPEAIASFWGSDKDKD